MKELQLHELSETEMKSVNGGSIVAAVLIFWAVVGITSGILHDRNDNKETN